MGKQSRRIRMKDETMTKERLEEGQQKWQELMKIRDAHHSLDIDPKYKKEACWIALEIADENEDWYTFNQIYCCQEKLMKEHIEGTMPCLKWKFVGNEPIFDSPWKKGESYTHGVKIFNENTKEIEFRHYNK